MHQQPPHTPLFASTSRANAAHVSTSKGRTEKAAVVSLAALGSLTGTVSACTQRLVHLFASEALLAALAGVPVRVRHVRRGWAQVADSMKAIFERCCDAGAVHTQVAHADDAARSFVKVSAHAVGPASASGRSATCSGIRVARC